MDHTLQSINLTTFFAAKTTQYNIQFLTPTVCLKKIKIIVISVLKSTLIWG